MERDMKAFSLEGRTVLITGASSGIGRQIAIAMGEAGANLALVARRVEALEETADLAGKAGSPRVITIGGDVVKHDSITAAVEKTATEFGHIHASVVNAGIQNLKPFLDFTDAEWRSILETNVVGSLVTIREVGKHMVANGGGSIIAMGSIYGLVGANGASVYCMTKGAVMQLVKSLSIEWARYNIRLNSISPGWIQTDLTAPYSTDEKVTKSALRNIPLHRFGETRDISPAAVYLASDASSYITGQTIVIDGGQTAR
jgi:NAD(P)-dependent dehydrogenase (short-subunit alcohol dehydrogenase family)